MAQHKLLFQIGEDCPRGDFYVQVNALVDEMMRINIISSTKVDYENDSECSLIVESSNNVSKKEIQKALSPFFTKAFDFIRPVVN